MRTKTNIFNEITEAKKNRAAKLADLKKNLAKCESEKAAAETKAAEALKADNAEAYTAAKSAERTAMDKVEYYNIQIENITAARLFDPEETRAKVDELKTYVDNVKAEMLKEAAPLICKAAANFEAVQEEINKANAAIQDLESKSTILDLALNGLCRSINNVKTHGDIAPYIK